MSVDITDMNRNSSRVFNKCQECDGIQIPKSLRIAASVQTFLQIPFMVFGPSTTLPSLALRRRQSFGFREILLPGWSEGEILYVS